MIVTNWKRVIVGDVFAVDSRDKNFNRHMFWLFPFFFSAS